MMRHFVHQLRASSRYCRQAPEKRVWGASSSSQVFVILPTSWSV